MGPMKAFVGCFMGHPNDSVQGVDLAVVGYIGEDCVVDKVMNTCAFWEQAKTIIVQQETAIPKTDITKNREFAN